MYNVRGVGYKGSPSLQTSVANAEILPNPPAGWTIPYTFYEFGFYNQEACTIKINNEDGIYLIAGQGFQATYLTKPITSFKIVEAGIRYNWIGAY